MHGFALGVSPGEKLLGHGVYMISVGGTASFSMWLDEHWLKQRSGMI